jgi:hypothetical protein
VALVAVGVKLYALPVVMVVAGMPLIVGIGSATVIEKAGREIVPVMLVALITMLPKVPTLTVVGVPVNAPVDVLKVAHEGMLLMLKLVAFVAVGVKP